jgi:hypothetical protein
LQFNAIASRSNKKFSQCFTFAVRIFEKSQAPANAYAPYARIPALLFLSQAFCKLSDAKLEHGCSSAIGTRSRLPTRFFVSGVLLKLMSDMMLAIISFVTAI